MTAFAPLTTREFTASATFDGLDAVRLTRVFAPTVRVLMDEVRSISTGVMPDTVRLFEASINTLGVM